MGRVFKKGKYWYIDYVADGRRHRKKHGRYKKFAEIHLKVVEIQIARGELRIPKDEAIEKFFENFLAYAGAHARSKEGWSPKGMRGREIPLNDELFELLIKQKEKTKDRFVPDKDGIRKYDRALWENFWRLAKKLGIKNANIHTFRHTFASYMIMNGVDLVTVKELLGHRDITTTMRYAHLRPSHKHWAVNRICSISRTDTIWPQSKKYVM